MARRRTPERRSARIAASRSIPETQRWNHNIHYFERLLDAVPNTARTALDVGCGDGMLARRLALRVDLVVGIDLAPDQIALACASTHARTQQQTRSSSSRTMS